MSKKSKHLLYDDPTAFGKKFPVIRETDRPTNRLSAIHPNGKTYKMGKLLIFVAKPTSEMQGYFMSIQGKDSYPTWDEVVWIRYNLIADSARMAMILPNLNSYINQDDTNYKFVFTFEQTGWAFDPAPTCLHCGADKDSLTMVKLGGFVCQRCEWEFAINPLTWNEDHGNGYGG
jgi:hypothetical protein